MSTLPITLRAAVGLLALQALALTAITVFLVYAEITAPAGNEGVGWTIVSFAAVGAALLSVLAWGVARLKRWARDLAVATQLILLEPTYYMIKGELPWLGVIVGGVAIAVVALSVVPATNRALGVQA